MNALEIISLSGNIISVTLGIIAIWLSLHFYSKSKDTEKNVEVALSQIRAQTKALQTISARQLDRLTKFVTSPDRFESRVTEEVLKTLQSLPDDIVSKIPIPDQSNTNELAQEVLDSYVALYYYIGIANVWASLSLPSASEFDETDTFHNMVRNIIDRSYKDFMYMEQVLNSIGTEGLRRTKLSHLISEIHQVYRENIKNSAQIYAFRAKTSNT